MEQTIRIFLADASHDYLALLGAALNEEPDLAVIGTAADGAEAYRQLSEEKPDVLLTDLLLPRLDGLSLLRRLRDEGGLPHTLVISAFVNERMAQAVCRLGVDEYLPKPCDMGVIVRRIREAVDPATHRRVHNYDPAIQSALKAFGIPAYLHGRSYLQQAVQMALRDRGVLHGITKVLYPDLAKAFHTTAPCIERSMRSAILKAWDNGTAEERRACFGTTFDGFDKAPSNGRFVAAIAEFIELQYDQIDIWAAEN